MKPLINVWNSGISLLMLIREQRLQPMKTKTSQNAHRGSDFRDFLAGKGILPEVEVLAPKRMVSVQLQQILQHEPVTKTKLASRMKTSRASLDRILDPSNPSLTVASLGKATAALLRKMELHSVPA
jgi:antitoxin HicB